MATATTSGFGILGTGMIAKVVADAIEAAPSIRLAAVASRTQAKAEAFVADREGTLPLEGLETLLACEAVDAICFAIPTVGKHVLVDKPFVSAQSVARMAGAVADAGLVFMDTTHFVHHPRKVAVQAATAARVGRPHALHAVFYETQVLRDSGRPLEHPLRSDPRALGSTGRSRLILHAGRSRVPSGRKARCSAPLPPARAIPRPWPSALQRSPELRGRPDGDLRCRIPDRSHGRQGQSLWRQLYGDKGVILLDAFVVNWTNSFVRQIPKVRTDYTHRTADRNPTSFDFVEIASEVPPQVLMVESFRAMAENGDGEARAAFAAATLATQSYLDAAYQSLA